MAGFGTAPFGIAPFGGPAVVPMPPITPPGARWAWSFGDWHGLPTTELATVTARSLKCRLTGTSEASFTVDTNVPAAALIQELISDLWVMRNGFTLFRGRVGGATDSGDGTKDAAQFTVGDYRALLQRRQLWDTDTLTYTSTEQASIAWGLISSAQGQSGGNLNLSNGAAATGTVRTITYPAGQSVGQAIEQLSLMDGGFNWDVVPQTGSVGQTFTVWPSRGESRNRVVSYPGNAASYQRQLDPGTYANAVRETGNTGIAAVRAEASDIATRAEGRWDVQLGDTSLLDATSVTARANYDLSQRQEIVPTWTVKLQPGTWGGPTDMWLGDVVQLVVKSGRLDVDEQLRVFEVDIDLDDADNETVTLTLAALDPFKRARARQVEFRLTALERR